MKHLIAALTSGGMVALSLGFSHGAGAQTIVTSKTQLERSVRSYWSGSSRDNAVPMALRTVVGSPDAVAGDVMARRGPAGAVEGNPPSGSAPRAEGGAAPGFELPETAAQAGAPEYGAGSTVWYDYPPPSSIQIPVLDYLVAPLYPVTTLGKLFFSKGRSNFVCSASSVTSAGPWGKGNRQTVITAGHCCSDSSGFFSNWLFEPAHAYGEAPLGSWTAAKATVLDSWFEREDLSRDVCVLQMNTLNGANINDAVGALGYAYNQRLPQQYHATGWPAAAPFDGSLLHIVTASDAETDTAIAGDFPFTHGIGNVMTGGSSGGAWILNYQSWFGESQFNGLNSYKYTFPDRPAEMFGPYIDDVVINTLLRGVATAPPAP